MIRYYMSKRRQGVITKFDGEGAPDPYYWDQVIPIPVSLVTDELLDDLATLRIDTRILALRKALIDGRPKPEPLAEPTDLSARVLDKYGLEWAKVDGSWISVPYGPFSWGDLTETFGPLRLAGDKG